MKVISGYLECVNINKRLMPTKADSENAFLDLSNLTELLMKNSTVCDRCSIFNQENLENERIK